MRDGQPGDAQVELVAVRADEGHAPPELVAADAGQRRRETFVEPRSLVDGLDVGLLEPGDGAVRVAELGPEALDEVASGVGQGLTRLRQAWCPTHRG